MYTSLPETGLNNDVYFNDELRQAICDAKIVIVVISQDYLSREYCLCELGAIWALNKPRFFFNVQGIQRNNLPELATGKKYDMLDNAGLDRLCDTMVKIGFEPKDKSYTAWNSLKERVLANIGAPFVGSKSGTTKSIPEGSSENKKESYKQGSQKTLNEGINALNSLPDLMRRACIAEVEKLVWMPGVSSPYTGQIDHIDAYGYSYDYPILKNGVCFRDIDGKVYYMKELLQERRNNPQHHMNWIKAQYYMYTYDKDAILKDYAKEIEGLRVLNKRDIGVRKSVRDIINCVAAEKAYYDRTTQH